LSRNNDIFVENMEKYKNPELYDLEYDGYIKDLPLLLEWAQKKGGPIVDLACGTGRVTIPIAEKDIEMIGIDLNKGMLERAEQKSLEKELQITWSLQDCSNFTLDIMSPFIYMTGNSFQHFLTNESQDDLLRSIHRHLCKDGIFIFGTRFPQNTELITTRTTEETYNDKLNRKVTEYYEKVYDPITQILHSTSIRKLYSQDKKIDTKEKDNISMRFVYPKEMDRLLEQNGYRIVNKYGSWTKETLNSDSLEMIYVCQKI
jgi:ubiquinone/menaquinone biosynthesis C-methylase UbiE